MSPHRTGSSRSTPAGPTARWRWSPTDTFEAAVTLPAPGTLADPAAAEGICQVIGEAVDQLGRAASDCERAAAGLAGLWDHWEEVEPFTSLVEATLPVGEVMVTSDIVVACAGASGSSPAWCSRPAPGRLPWGSVLTGTFARVDGWGHRLGDAASGHWLGRAGLTAALRAHDEGGPHMRLTGRASHQHGDLERLPATLAGAPDPVQAVGAFSTEVVAAAVASDRVAKLAATVSAAAPRYRADRGSRAGRARGPVGTRGVPNGRLTRSRLPLARAGARPDAGAACRPPTRRDAG